MALPRCPNLVQLQCQPLEPAELSTKALPTKLGSTAPTHSMQEHRRADPDLSVVSSPLLQVASTRIQLK
uniref:Uncharacterized protein n=1 Tax=Physcomitrium patens TaxID=3218 RepID=A0A2K1JCV0_PHYPA|nr:hypothetical protein PHYPA_019617 [Physcomitrium patens]